MNMLLAMISTDYIYNHNFCETLSHTAVFLLVLQAICGSIVNSIYCKTVESVGH